MFLRCSIHFHAFAAGSKSAKFSFNDAGAGSKTCTGNVFLVSLVCFGQIKKTARIRE